MATALPRITARVDEETQSLLQKAATVAGVTSINSFVLSAAVEKAKMILDRESRLVLNPQDADALFEALDREPQSLVSLAAAAENYLIKSE